jgi:hypothetical protein
VEVGAQIGRLKFLLVESALDFGFVLESFRWVLFFYFG